MSNHGFIDPEANTRAKVDRLDLIIDMLLRNLTEDALSPEARRLLRGIRNGDPKTVKWTQQLMDEDPL